MKSLVIHPASTTHSQLNDQELAEQQIYQNTIRLSIGTEHIDDIIADLEAGFALFAVSKSLSPERLRQSVYVSYLFFFFSLSDGTISDLGRI